MGMDLSNDPDDEIAIDPLPVPSIPIPRVVPALAGRLRGQLTPRRGGLLAVVAVVVLIGALKLSGVIWTPRPPAWVAALGQGVTVTQPEQVAPGQGSPGAVLAGVLVAVSSQHPAASCQYIYAPGVRCTAQFSHTPHNQLPFARSLKIGYVAIDRTRALVGYTGKICSPGNSPECQANANPAAIFSAGDSFTTLWAQATGPTFGGGYSLQPCFKVSGKWYLGAGPPADSSYASRVNAPSRRAITPGSPVEMSPGLPDLGQAPPA